MQLTFIIIAAALLGVFSRFLKQPLILAYIITGLLLGPLVLNYITPSDTLTLFSQLGITLLLFIVGLSMNFNVLKKFGLISLVTGIGQVVFTSVIGFFIVRFLGFSFIEALYISVALTFSSTIIIVKLLSDKNDLNTLYGRISVGFLLVQDFIAILILILISGIQTGQESTGIIMLLTFLKGLGLLLMVFLFGKYIASYLFKKLAKVQELLFVSGLAWCFIVIFIAQKMNFSIEIGAFLAGLALGTLPYNQELGNKLKPLRDFFIVLFFVNLGLQVVIAEISALIWPAIILSLFVLIGNPLIVIVLMGLFGYKPRTGLLAGLTVAQISEFSLILVNLGLAANHVGSSVVTLVTLIGIFTIAVSTYMIMNGEFIYRKLSGYLKIFERKKLSNDEIKSLMHSENYNILLFGAHRAGYSIVKSLAKSKEKFLVVDYDPDVISKLKSQNIDCFYGDISDIGTLDELVEFEPKIVISTVPILEDNLILLKYFKKKNKETMFIAVAKTIHDVLALYKAGAEFVILPEVLTGVKISDYLTHLNSKGIREWGKKYYKSILEDINKGLI